uniref:Transposase (Putative), gypsy type n=1 Tax=Tanacetum cinerariifolium TaxID=118510 RepID=A0A6L2K1G3_TANCI|nr:hypothetical protein [Tanacetum cinerariifolium]
MSRDRIQLETAISTIFHEYLLEFTSEYGISKDLHPELPGLEERIVDFPEDMDLFNLIIALNSSKVKTGLRPCAAHEVPLLTAITSRVIDMEDPDVATESSGTPSAIEKSPLDFDNENPSPPMTEGKGTEYQAHETVAPEIPSENMHATRAALEVSLEEEVAAMGPRLSKKRRRRVNDGADANAPAKVLRKDYASVRPEQSTHGGKSLPTMGLAAGSTFVTPVDMKGVSDPDPLSYAEPQPHPEQGMTQSFEIPTGYVATMEVQDTHSAESAGSGKSTSSPSMVGSPGGIYQPRWGVTNNYRLDTPDACQDVVDHIMSSGYFFELRHMPNAEFLSQYNKNLAQQVAMGSQLRLRFEQEVRLLKKARAQTARRDQRIQVREEKIKKLDQEVQGLQNRTSNLKTLLKAEVDMKKAAEAKNADLTKELESLLTQFLDLQVSNDQQTQQVSTLKTQVTGKERIRAAFEELKKYEDDGVEKRCAEMDALVDALSINFNEELYPHMLTAIAGHRWVIGHGLRLAVMKCAELIELRQAFANVVSAGIAKGMSESLAHGIEHGKAGRGLEVVEAYDPEANIKYLQSDSGEDALKWIRDLRPSTSQLKIHAYPKVRDPRDPWVVKEEMLLEEAITANVSHPEKKKRCWVVCCTYGIGSTHHATFDGIPVSVPTVAPQGLAILIVDAATQTETSEDDASPRLLRSKSLPPMYNLDWP